MGVELGESSPPSFFSSADILDDLCPTYLTMGMSLEEYWNGDIDYAVFVRKAYNRKREIENENHWLQGRYIYDALQCVAPLLNAFSKRPKAHPYLEKPYEFESKNKEEKKIKETNQTQKAAQAFERIMNGFNNKKKEKDGEDL